MDTNLTITEGLLIVLSGQDYVDGTNIVDALRRGQQAVMEATQLTEADLHVRMLESVVDHFIIFTTKNGAVDIFTA